MCIDVAAFEFDDDGIAGCIDAAEDKGDHPAVNNSAIDLEIVFGFDGVEELVVDFGFGIAGVVCIVLEFSAKFGIYLVAAAVGERLEDFGEEDIFVAKKLEGLAIKGLGVSVPYAQKEDAGEQGGPCT